MRTLLIPKTFNNIFNNISLTAVQCSWHQTVGHGDAGSKVASRTTKRFLFDLSLLEREQLDPRYTDSDHTLYYLGAVYCALVEGDPEYQIPFLTGAKLSDSQREHAEKVSQMWGFLRLIVM